MTKEIVITALSIAKAIQQDSGAEYVPPSDCQPAAGERVVYKSLVSGTRGYIERVAHQINGTYEHGWYDACAVMIRRLLETLIIEVFERNHIPDKIRNSNGHYLQISDLIPILNSENSISLGRECKRALPKFKKFGHASAHNRRYNAQRQDIDSRLDDLRIVIQELLYLARLK